MINIEPGRDIVTLLTCTPYMINSHRLLSKHGDIGYSYTEDMAKAIEKADYLEKMEANTDFGRRWTDHF